MNGWTNWDTWETYNLLTSYEDIYLQAQRSPSLNNLLVCLYAALSRTWAPRNHIAFNNINWNSVRSQLMVGC